jgi:hypothetical protein
MPDIFQMARDGARRNQYNIDTEFVGYTQILVKQLFGSGGHAAQTECIHGDVKIGLGSAGLYLDKRDSAPAMRDYINFTNRCTCTFGYDPPTFQAKVERRLGLAFATTRFCCLPLAWRFAHALPFKRLANA